jgi:hypothetical protein
MLEQFFIDLIIACMICLAAGLVLAGIIATIEVIKED